MITDNELPREARTGPIFHPDWGTHAYERYSGYVRELDALFAMVFPMDVDAERSARYLAARRLRVENHFSGPWAINVGRAMLSWQVAMRVSAVEVYLQNALTFLAVYDPQFIRSRGSKQEWDYDAIRVASDNDDVLWTFCNQWARSFVGDGGPQRWSSALHRAGLGEFAESDLTNLEAMWAFDTCACIMVASLRVISSDATGRSRIGFGGTGFRSPISSFGPNQQCASSPPPRRVLWDVSRRP